MKWVLGVDLGRVYQAPDNGDATPPVKKPPKK